MDARMDARVAALVAALEPYRFEYDALPLKSAIDTYVRTGVPTGGSFVQALLCGDYKLALTQADGVNRWLLPIYAAYLYNELPADVHGSYENVTSYITRKRESRAAHAVARKGDRAPAAAPPTLDSRTPKDG